MRQQTTVIKDILTSGLELLALIWFDFYSRLLYTKQENADVGQYAAFLQQGQFVQLAEMTVVYFLVRSGYY